MLDDSFEVETGVPIPLRKANPKYDWEKLGVGQSVFIATKIRQKTIHSAALGWAKRRGLKAKFITRSLTERGKKGVRIWRLK